MASKIEKIHQETFHKKALSWSFGEEYLDTDCLRKLHYGNLVLRRQAHLPRHLVRQEYLRLPPPASAPVALLHGRRKGAYLGASPTFQGTLVRLRLVTGPESDGAS